MRSRRAFSIAVTFAALLLIGFSLMTLYSSGAAAIGTPGAQPSSAVEGSLLGTDAGGSCIDAGLTEPKLLEAWVRHPGDRKTQSIFAEADWRALPVDCDATAERVPSVRFQLQNPTNHARWINVGGFVRPSRNPQKVKEEIELEKEAEGKSCWDASEAGKSFICGVSIWVTNKGGEGYAAAPKAPGWPDPIPSLEKYRYRCTPGPGKTHVRALIKNVVRNPSTGEVLREAVYRVPVKVKSYPYPPHPGHPKRDALQGPC